MRRETIGAINNANTLIWICAILSKYLERMFFSLKTFQGILFGVLYSECDTLESVFRRDPAGIANSSRIVRARSVPRNGVPNRQSGSDFEVQRVESQDLAACSTGIVHSLDSSGHWALLRGNAQNLTLNNEVDT